MADKAITELVAAEQITATDLFVLQQNNTAKKLPAQVLLNWLTAAADGHGGIQSIVKLSTSGLVDTYRITLADTTIFDFVVTNGRAIRSITQTEANSLTRTYTIAFNDGSSETFSVADGRGIQSFLKTSTEGLVDTYTVTYNDGTRDTFTVKNGEKGDKGDNAYIWVKYASQEPSAGSSSFGDLPDDWMGVYFGTASTAPTDWQQYKWYRIKGEKGDTGEPATVTSNVVEYQAGDSGTIIPSGAWSSSVPVVAQGRYLWTRTITAFNSGSPAVSYSVSRTGIDGTGSVSSVAGISPDPDGNVPLTASDVGALPNTGGDLTGELKMNGQPISGLNPPTADDQAANKGYVDAAKREANTYTNQQVKKAALRNLLDNSDWRVKERIVNQRGQDSYIRGNWGDYTIDRWKAGSTGVTATLTDGGMKINGSFFQPISADVATSLNGKKVTIAVKIDGNLLCYSGTMEVDGVYHRVVHRDYAKGIISVTTQEKTNQCFITITANEDAVIEWIALYEGEYTLDTLPEYHSKGYAVELAECRRYYQIVGKLQKTGAVAIGSCYNATSARFVMPISPMRKENPSVNPIFTNDMPLILVNGAAVARGELTFTQSIYKDSGQMALDVIIDGGTTNAIALLLTNNACWFEIDANL